MNSCARTPPSLQRYICCWYAKYFAHGLSIQYHAGFRHQVESWPTNPVDIYIEQLSSFPPTSVIADLGCGDAALARALTPKGYIVLSFDLVSNSPWIVEADVCTRIPLPGSEEDGGDAAAVVDICVCALSLMNSNWVQCLREARRVLKQKYVDQMTSAGIDLTCSRFQRRTQDCGGH